MPNPTVHPNLIKMAGNDLNVEMYIEDQVSAHSLQKLFSFTVMFCSPCVYLSLQGV